MDDKHLSGEEKRRKLKEEYLKELRARKQILDEAKKNQYLNNINKALDEMTSFTDDSDEWIAKLNGESLIQEAKLDTVLPEEEEKKEDELRTEEETEFDKEFPIKKTLGDIEK